MTADYITQKIYNSIIVGAGAAGLFYAAADTSPGSKLILEKTSRPGQKLLMSGNGMCNITHGGSIKEFPPHYGKPGSRIRGCLYNHNNLKLMDFIKSGGISLVEREDGKIFPASHRASDILDFLLAKAVSNGYEFRYGCPVTGIKCREEASLPLVVLFSDAGRSAGAATEKLIIATGGASYPATGSDGSFMDVLKQDLGIKITELKPALAPVYIQNYPYKSISGVSFECVEVTCNGHVTSGPMLLTHKGLSGPAILHISQHARAGLQLHLNFLPELSTPEVYTRLKKDQPGNNKGISNYISQAFGLPKAFTATMFPDPSRKFSTVGHKELENVAHLLTDRIYQISGTGDWNEAMVTAGGVSLSEVNLKNMSLTSYPDIRIIGEALDINGDTGGYNLQFAYSSAMAALNNL